MRKQTVLPIVALIGWFGMLALTGLQGSVAPQPFLPARLTPRPPQLQYTIARTGPLDVAKVFGRSPACAEASADFIQEVSNDALDAGLDPKLEASTVAVESGCNNFAVSARGAVGLMQVMPKIWKDHYDFTDQFNLFNEHDNLRVGARILAGLVQQYGVEDGARRYNGVGSGTDCSSCDPEYTKKILTLAGVQ